jgi:hypothetical protein
MRLLRPSRFRATLLGAAVALGLITVLASAGTAATAATNSTHTLRPATTLSRVVDRPNETASGQKIIPNVLTGDQCSSSTAHWFTVHIYWDGGVWQYWCYGGNGSFSWPDDNQIAWACAGNNYGTFVYYDWATGKDVTVNFSPGWSTNLGADDEMVSLKLTGWKGSYNC